MKHLHLSFRGIILWGMTLVACACDTQCVNTQMKMEVCVPMPMPLAAATCFAVGDNAYVFAGRDNQGICQNGLWKYDATTDEWTDLGDTPLTARVNATACVYDGQAFVGLGYNTTSDTYLTDWWRYDPTTNGWKRLNDFPAQTTARAMAMVGEGKLYVGYGFCWTYERDMYCYDIHTNTWEYVDVHLDRKATTFPIRSFGGVGCSCQNRHFAGTGFRGNSLNWWGEFLPEQALWIKRKEVPGYKRTTAAIVATDDHIYVVGGMYFGGVNTDGQVLADIQQYDPQTDTWCGVGELPCGGRMNHLAVHIGNRIYMGMGEDENMTVCGEWYCMYEK